MGILAPQLLIYLKNHPIRTQSTISQNCILHLDIQKKNASTKFCVQARYVPSLVM
jgi:hypothetical protein